MKEMIYIEKNTQRLIKASQKGQLEEVKKWLPVSDPKSNESYALRLASQYGHTEIVKLLIPVSDSKAIDSLALQLASSFGHVEVVKLLIPVSNPKANDSAALRLACDHKNQELFDMLYSVSDPEKALNKMKEENKFNQIWNTDLLEERIKSEHEKKKIQTVIQKMPQKSISKQKKI